MPSATGLRTRNFFALLPDLVVVVVDAVVGGLEVVIFLGVAADAERGEANLVLSFAVLVVRIHHLERVAGLGLALEVDVVGVDADQILDHAVGHVVAQRGLIQALIEPHAGAVVLLGLVVLRGDFGVDVADVDGDVLAAVRQRRRRRDPGIAENHHPLRLHVARAGGRHQDAQALAFLEAAIARRRAQHRDDLLDLVGRRGEFAQDRADGFALLGDDDALAPFGAAVGLRRGLGQKRHVFGNDAGREAEIARGIAFGGIAQLDAAGGVGIGENRSAPIARPACDARATRLITSSIDNSVDGLTLGSSELMSQPAAATLPRAG